VNHREAQTESEAKHREGGAESEGDDCEERERGGPRCVDRAIGGGGGSRSIIGCGSFGDREKSSAA